AYRPGVRASTPVEAQVRALIAADAQHCDGFCTLEQHTTFDTFGRVEGKYLRTAGNLTKADGWHGGGLFREHNPLAIHQELEDDVFTVSALWAERAHALDALAR